MTDFQALIAVVMTPLAIIAAGVAMGTLIIILLIDALWSITE